MPAINTMSAPSAWQSRRASTWPGYWQALSADELVALCRRGEPGAFAVLMRRYERRVYALAYRLAGNYDDAHEITSETFLRAYRCIGRIQNALTLTAWLNRIATNIYRDMWRRADRHPLVSLDDLPEKTRDAVLNADCPPFVSPHAQAEENDRKRILDDAIASLPADHRALVTLFHSNGRTYDEIAQTMRIPVGTVKSRLHRARSALRQSLAPERAAFMD